MRQIKLDKENFLDRFLTPNLKIGDSPLRLECDSGYIKSVLLKDQNKCIFFNKIPVQESDFNGTLNIVSLQLIRNVVKQIEGMSVIIQVHENHIIIPSGKIEFKIYVLDDRFINQKKLDETLFESLMKDIQIKFELDNSHYRQLQANRNILNGDVKVYFSTKNEKLVVLLGDQDKSYSNEITHEFDISVNIPEQFVMDSYFFDAISVKDENISVKTDGKKLVVMQVENHKKYIFPLLTK